MRITPEKNREYHLREREKDPERFYELHKIRSKRYRERHAAQTVRANGNYRKRNPEKYKAHYAVARARKTGKLIRQACWCGNVNSQAHHEDYSKPLEVVWLCQKHHKELHRTI